MLDGANQLKAEIYIVIMPKEREMDESDIRALGVTFPAVLSIYPT